MKHVATDCFEPTYSKGSYVVTINGLSTSWMYVQPSSTAPSDFGFALDQHFPRIGLQYLVCHHTLAEFIVKRERERERERG